MGHLRSALLGGEWQLGEQTPRVLAQLQGVVPAEWLPLLSGPCQDLETWSGHVSRHAARLEVAA